MSASHLNSAGSDSSKLTGPVTSYMTIGNTRYCIEEYFPSDGKPLDDLLIDLVIAKIKQSQTG